MEFSKMYYHHVSKTTDSGMEEIFRCKFANKKGFENCRMQCKVVFPGCDTSVQLFLTSDSHEHGRKMVITEVTQKLKR